MVNFRAKGFLSGSVVLAALILLSVVSAGWGQVDIKAVREKSVLGEDDLNAIGQYVAETFRQMIEAKSPTDLANIVRDFIESSTSKATHTEAPQQAYARRFAESVVVEYQKLLELLPSMPDVEMAYQVRLSAVVVLSYCSDTAVVKYLSELLGDESPDVRYWAVKGLGSGNLFEQLSQANSGDPMVEEVMAALKTMLESTDDSELLAQTAQAAAMPNHLPALEVLQECMKKRIVLYENWTVTNEMVDLVILKQLFSVVDKGVLSEDDEFQKSLLRTGAQLYSAAYYRYSKGMLYRDEDGTALPLLNGPTQQNIQTLLIEGELGWLSVSRSSRPVSRFMVALKRNNWSELDNSYKQLLSVGGQVDQAFGFYGGGQNGEVPLPVLPDPLASVVNQARTRLLVEEKAVQG